MLKAKAVDLFAYRSGLKDRAVAEREIVLTYVLRLLADTGRAAHDALFELTDAVLLTPLASSFAELSLCPAFRRRWPSVYEALQDGRPDRQGLLKLYVGQLPTNEHPILAGDHTAWPRLSAPINDNRTFEHHPTKIWGNKPITIGHG